MKTIEELVKAINYRLEQLELFNQQLVDLNKNDDADLMHIYFENEARMSELNSLLEFINSKKKV